MKVEMLGDFELSEDDNREVLTYKYLFLDLVSHEVLLLGYGLKLTNPEFSFLSFLVENAGKYSFPTDFEKSRGSAAALVFRVNSKAGKISGRKLIISSRGRGYMLNPYM